MKKTAFLRCFLTQKKTFSGNIHTYIYTFYLLKFLLLKSVLALILLISVFSLSNLHFLLKIILSNRFATLFSHSQPFNKMFFR